MITTFLTIQGTITYITLANASGASVTLSSLGAGIVEINVPDRSGKIDNIVLNYADAESYYNDGPAMGKVPGRYANRIGGAKFSLDGETFNLIANLPPNMLHGGGEIGFHNKIWKVDDVTDNSVKFSLTSPDGEGGFPGELKVSALYRWSEDNELSLNLTGETDKATVINLTNHAYFNLKGATAGNALDHILQLNCSGFLETDNALVPTGRILDVKGTPMDFTTPHIIGERIGDDFDPLKFGKGYDHCFVIDNYETGKIRKVAVLSEPTSGRIVEILTDQPGAQLYTGNWLTGCPAGKNNHSYKDYDGVAIEAQDLPDSPNKPQFPSTRLNPGEKYSRNIIFKFNTEK